jgi:hypothetical protein
MVTPAYGNRRARASLPARRAGERGAAVFVVVMVLTMLTAIGIFAIRAASMANLSSGYDRQNTQNHYVGEYGLLSAVAELSTTKRSAYVEKMGKGVETCSATKGVKSLGTGIPCYHLYANDVAKAVSTNFSGRTLFEPANMKSSPIIPGSLGAAELEGDFVVEMTDPGPVGLPVAGTDVGGSAAKFKYLQVTLTSVGQVRPAGAPAACNAGAVVAGNEAGRAFVVIGPLP